MDPKNQILPILIGVTLLCFATTVDRRVDAKLGLDDHDHHADIDLWRRDFITATSQPCT